MVVKEKNFLYNRDSKHKHKENIYYNNERIK